MQAPQVVALDRLRLEFAPQPWWFATERRAEIDAYFERARAERPGIWNGEMLLLYRYHLDQRALEGAFLQTDYASFMTWRDSGFPHAGVINCFSMGALRSSDGAWLMGVMAPYTSASGSIYFPAGTPEPDDVVDGMVDLAGSVIREVAEETGLVAGDFAEQGGWYCVVDGARIALMKVLQAREPADVLRRRILDYLSHEAMPELSDVRVVRSRRDFDPMMPRFVTAFLDHTGFPGDARR